MNGLQSKIRICHLGKYYNPFRGGIETHVRAIAQAQDSSGANVSVACINHRDRQHRDVWSNRFAQTPTVDEWDGNVRVHRFGKFATLARFDFCRGLRNFLHSADQNYDLLHLHVPNPVMCVALAATRTQIPVVVTYHSDIVKQRFIRKPFRLVEDRVMSAVSRIIVATQAYRDSSPVLARYQEKTTVIPFGLDLQPYRTTTARAQAFEEELRRKAAGEPIWLCVGRLVYYKGTEIAIRALVNCPGRLVVVGGGELLSSLRELASVLNVAHRIDWYVSLDDEQLRGAYRAATALMFPSVVRSEAFGLVQIEAMASGCPVINTDIPGSGVPWVSVDTVSGLTVPIRDAEKLAEAARRIVYEPGLRRRLSEGAVTRAYQYFDFSDMTEQTMRVYSQALGRVTEPVAPRRPKHLVPSQPSPMDLATSPSR